MAALPGQRPVLVAVDALDEAASDQDRRQIAEALAELAVLPGMRVAVANPAGGHREPRTRRAGFCALST